MANLVTSDNCKFSNNISTFKRKFELIENYKISNEKEKEIAKVIEYCKECNVSTSAGIEACGCHFATKNDVNNRKYGRVAPKVHNQKSIMSKIETSEFIAYLIKAGENKSPLSREDQSAKIVEILKRREKALRMGCTYHSSERPVMKLNKNELKCISQGGPGPHWFHRFYAKYADQITEKNLSTQDKSRIIAATDESVNEHFFGDFGLETELIDCGIMDKQSKCILDPRRLLNCDETPEYLDYLGNGKKIRVAVGVGRAALAARSNNRESYTVNMVNGCDGFQYGPQLILARDFITSDLVEEENSFVTGPSDNSSSQVFNNTIDATDSFSRYMLLSTTKKVEFSL